MQKKKNKSKANRAEPRSTGLIWFQCMPCDRKFETTGQKCDSCKKHDLPCGPNVKKSDDPLACQKGDSSAENQPLVEEAFEDIVRDATSE